VGKEGGSRGDSTRKGGKEGKRRDMSMGPEPFDCRKRMYQRAVPLILNTCNGVSQTSAVRVSGTVVVFSC